MLYQPSHMNKLCMVSLIKVSSFYFLQITRQSIDALKNWFRDEMQKSDWQLIMELKKTFEIIWTQRRQILISDLKWPPTHIQTLYATLSWRSPLIMESSVLLIHLKTILQTDTTLCNPVSRTVFRVRPGVNTQLRPLFPFNSYFEWGSVGGDKKKKWKKREKKVFLWETEYLYHCFKQWQMLENPRQPLQLFQTCLLVLSDLVKFFHFVDSTPLTVHCKIRWTWTADLGLKSGLWFKLWFKSKGMKCRHMTAQRLRFHQDFRLLPCQYFHMPFFLFFFK